MSILDPILAPLAGAPDTVLALSQKVGLDPATAEKVIMSLAQAHLAQGDTIAIASQKTGMGKDALSQVVSELGGEETLRAIARGLTGGYAGSGKFTLLDELRLILPGVFGKLR